MNWKTIQLRNYALKSILLGVLAGLWGVLLSTGVYLLPIEEPYIHVLAGTAMGLAMGALLASVEEISNQYPGRATKTALMGGLLTALAGGFGMAHMAQLPAPESEAIFSFWLQWSLKLVLMAGTAGFGSGLGIRDVQKGIRRTFAMVLAGAIFSIPVTFWLSKTPPAIWKSALALSLWGGVLSFSVYWSERFLAKRWLRILSGPSEDHFHPLFKRTLLLGKLDANDIPLPDCHEVFPMHALIHWSKNHYQIVDDDQEGMVLVNFRPVQIHELRSGDVIKIGSALLQYGEKN